jgi:hypothetical protein
VIKNLLKACALVAGIFVIQPVAAQTVYNSVATAYLQTTISQSIVFDSTMQAGGTFNFSVLAHNGGGRQNQNDTANVSITFYSANGTQISTVATSYSNNLPQPTASSGVNSQGVTLSGNPQADPAVPWTTLSVSSTNCGGSCANVAYAVVKMYGIDASYWAGDYGPWYRAPTLTLNSGNNLVYNPEFGPYNGTNIQGWTASPAMGACQGAWGGSNACIVDANGTPGQNTPGLVANQNGGGPSATGGSTNGTPGGYNNTMSVSNPGPGTTGGAAPAPAPAPVPAAPAPAPVPAAPTVVSTAPGTSTVTSTNTPGTTTTTSTSTAGTTVNTSAATRGVTVTTVSQADAGVRGAKTIDVTRTITTTNTTPVTTVTTHTTPITTVTVATTPITTTTVTTPTVVTTWSDGTTTTANGNPVTTTSTTNQVVTTTSTANQVTYTTVITSDVQSSSTNSTKSASANGFSDAIKIRNTNPFLIDALSQKDGAWISPSASYYKTVGTMTSGGTGAGYQWTVENNTFGVALGYSSAKSGGLTGSSVQFETYDSTAYILSKQEDFWVKGSIGFGLGNYSGSTSIPIFALYNSTKFKQYNYYADISLYTAETFEGFRPLIGVMVNQSQIKNYNEIGSALLSTSPNMNSTTVNPYVGVRYDFDKNISIETRVTQTKDFKTVAGVRGVAKTEIDKGVFLNATVGFDKGKDYTGAVGTIGLKIDF